MNELYNLELSDIEIKNMLEMNPDILTCNDGDVKARIHLLKQLGCNNRQAKNIIFANPWYLNRCIGDVTATLNKLNQIGLEEIYLLIHENPLLLNVDVFEIEDFINRKKQEQYNMDDIIAMIEEDSNVITE